MRIILLSFCFSLFITFNTTNSYGDVTNANITFGKNKPCEAGASICESRVSGVKCEIKYNRAEGILSFTFSLEELYYLNVEQGELFKRLAGNRPSPLESAFVIDDVTSRELGSNNPIEASETATYELKTWMDGKTEMASFTVKGLNR